MNDLLKRYMVDVEYPDVSGAEHMEMLQNRDKLVDIEPMLSSEERQLLVTADQRLVEQAAAFYHEVARFIELAAHRQTYHIAPARWWWSLDVLSEVPSLAAPSLPTSDVTPSR